MESNETIDMRRQMQRLPIFGLVTDFCRNLLLRLIEEGALYTKNYNPFGEIYQKAIFDMLLRDPMNLEAFVYRDYDDIIFSEHKSKKGKDGKIKKLISVRADLAKRAKSYSKVSK